MMREIKSDFDNVRIAGLAGISAEEERQWNSVVTRLSLSI
jgi:hypothetical protein